MCVCVHTHTYIVYIHYVHLHVCTITIRKCSCEKRHKLRACDLHLFKKIFLINLFFSQSWDIFLETTGNLSSPNPEYQTQTEGTIFLRQLLKTVSAWLLPPNWPVTNRLVSRWLLCLSWLISNQESSFVHRQAKCEWWKEPSLSFFFFFKVKGKPYAFTVLVLIVNRMFRILGLEFKRPAFKLWFC